METANSKRATELRKRAYHRVQFGIWLLMGVVDGWGRVVFRKHGFYGVEGSKLRNTENLTGIGIAQRQWEAMELITRRGEYRNKGKYTLPSSTSLALTNQANHPRDDHA
jgi:hypothetical protein